MVDLEFAKDKMRMVSERKSAVISKESRASQPFTAYTWHDIQHYSSLHITRQEFFSRQKTHCRSNPDSGILDHQPGSRRQTMPGAAEASSQSGKEAGLEEAGKVISPPRTQGKWQSYNVREPLLPARAAAVALDGGID
ncbi:hypothetical protein MLD38_007004 [Melastoma candidum]|uniref:Uncharacterized protein n=1 Tax=Melastoma candidum TaxID=119954 RepID=A0ACB9RP85_9MYRT|nr:hypothetical protein MLD38_007004 [Melastoma candidum]